MSDEDTVECPFLEQMSHFTWVINNIDSVRMFKSPRFSLHDSVKFRLVYHKDISNDVHEIYMRPEVEDMQSTIPNYAIKATISIMGPNKSYKELLFTHKTKVINSNSRGFELRHVLWLLGSSEFLCNRDKLVDCLNELTFYCLFGILSDYEKNMLDDEDPWCESLCMERLVKDLDELRLNEDSSIELKCGGMTLRAHEIILSARSGKFADMFRNKSAREQEVEIKDMEFEVLENLITYIYSGRLKECKPSTQLLMKLYSSAIDYKVEPLKMMASSRLVDILNDSTLPIILKTLDSSTDVDKERFTDLSLDLLKLADANSDELFKKSIILSIVGDKDFTLKSQIWKEFRTDNRMFIKEVYDRLANEL